MLSPCDTCANAERRNKYEMPRCKMHVVIAFIENRSCQAWKPILIKQTSYTVPFGNGMQLSSSAGPITTNELTNGTSQTTSKRTSSRTEGPIMLNHNQKQTTPCKGCGDPIIFIRTKEGKYMPCNPKPVKFWYCEDGPDVIITGNGSVVHCDTDGYTLSPMEPIGQGYVPHWATCASPTQFRARK